MTIPDKKRVGCIGAGNMGSAIIIRLAESIGPEYVSAYDIDGERVAVLEKNYGITVSDSLESLSEKSDVVIIAVKPDTVRSVLNSIKDYISTEKIVVSIAAGISIKSIERIIGSSIKIVRIMPNTPSLVGEGMSVLSPNDKIDDASLNIVEKIFSKIGKVLVLPERLMDAVTGVSGSGPAYVFTFIQAMADGGVKLGIPREEAIILASQTVLGSAKYLLESGEDPIALRGKVTSPGGTTIEAVRVLERSGFAGIIMDAVESAALKSEKLGEK